MKRGVELITSPDADSRPGVYDALVSIVPEVVTPYRWFRATLHDDDPRLQHVYDVFAKFSIECADRSNPRYREIERSSNGYFTRRYVHLFTEEELSSASHFLMWCRDADYDNLCIAPSHDGSKLCIYVSPSPRSQKLMYCFPQVFVREKFKQTLEAENFKGLRLREAIAVRESGKMKKETAWPEGRKIYLLESPIELPRMPAAEVIVNPEMERNWWWNPGFDDKQPVYVRSQLEAIGTFDYAGTWECSYPHSPWERHPIVSQRFRQFCLKHKMRFEFVPVKYVD
jgi:hypothetical protein